MSRFQSGQFAKPENALKRAEELIAVGQKNSALQALHDVVTSKVRRWLAGAGSRGGRGRRRLACFCGAPLAWTP
jgi:hypothetical protein